MADEKKTEPDYDHDINASVARLQELLRGRQESEVPIGKDKDGNEDPYWKARNKHMAAYAKGNYKPKA